MENLIKIKSDIGVQLTDRELSVRWWGRLSTEEKGAILKNIHLHTILVLWIMNLFIGCG